MKAAVLIGLALTGCFYVDPINQRPSIDIRSQGMDSVHRGEPVMLEAVFDDPDGQPVSFAWKVYACSDAGCDDADIAEGSEQQFAFKAPIRLADNITPAQSVRVTLDAQDDLGAKARPQQELVIPTLDAPPTVELRKSQRYGYVLNTPIELFAKIGDVDDGRDPLPPPQWKVYTPNSQPAYDLVDNGKLDIPADPDHWTYAQTFTPKGTGDWTIEVTATDPVPATTVQQLAIHVTDDNPPCLAQWDPLTPPPGQTLPITAPTVFSVPIVNDDLDLYPADPTDPVLGVTAFTWSLKRNAGPRLPLSGASGNAIDFDPAGFTPGDIVELRVEIADRVSRSLGGCGDAPECSLMSNGCLQRVTWRVEVR